MTDHLHSILHLHLTIVTHNFFMTGLPLVTASTPTVTHS